MRRLIAAALGALAALAFAGAASAGVSVGVNDDAGKYADGDAQFWQTMARTGLKQNAVTVLWDETRPTTIVDQGFIQHSLPAAQAAGVKVVFDVYPMHSQALTGDSANIQRFAAFVGQLARAFPQVKEYVVMNECNQTRFVNPQFDGNKQNQSAAICGQALAGAYDALKAVDPGIFVWGVGLSPRGNDNADASSNVSTSPVKFLGYLGQWYRSSGRTRPLMDGFDFHPYPIPQSLPFAQGYNDTDNASVSNLTRIYQAFYDAFKGTAQPTIGQQAGGGLPVSLNEVGIQTLNTGKAGYTGSENAASSNGGVLGATATESFQASWYTQMLNLVACDPNVKVVNLFHLVDESDLGGWQSGLFYVGYQPKQSAGAVQQWIAQSGGGCSGQSRSWTAPGASPVGGGDTSGGSPSTTALSLLLAGPLGNLVSGLPGSSLTPAGSLAGLLGQLATLLGNARQDLNLTVGLTYVGGASLSSARGLSSAAAAPVAKTTVKVKKGAKIRVSLKTKKLKAGYYTLRFDLKAVKGSAKASLTTKPFYLAANGALGAPAKAKPGKPTTPAKPAKPSTPAKPTKPAKPDKPDKPKKK
ncbi:MAG TPA: hypothetical protein VIU86_10005 [Gaiellaceae bacterium]